MVSFFGDVILETVALGLGFLRTGLAPCSVGFRKEETACIWDAIVMGGSRRFRNSYVVRSCDSQRTHLESDLVGYVLPTGSPIFIEYFPSRRGLRKTLHAHASHDKKNTNMNQSCTFARRDHKYQKLILFERLTESPKPNMCPAEGLEKEWKEEVELKGIAERRIRRGRRLRRR
jgi:hypothetical protein